ncbi:unnamed protein product [Staurois parvus]|uniref:Copper transport protein n=1 Tax=Staurois parvus TaxID=386267 RepID=A0ABN9DYB0_9NEOB|nr:unnamed protein product [Staurois parvus]
MLTVLYELSKVLKSNLLSRVLLTLPLTPDSSLSPSLISDSEANVSANSDPLTHRWWFLHSSLALLHTSQVFLGYVLMLCVMSYNSAIFLSVIIGSGLGYYLAFPVLAKFPKLYSL